MERYFIVISLILLLLTNSLLGQTREEAQELLKQMNDPKFVGINKYIEKDDLDMVKVYVIAGADLNIAPSYPDVLPLEIAIKKNNFLMTKYLLESGASVDIFEKHDNIGYISTLRMFDNTDIEILELLLKKGLNPRYLVQNTKDVKYFDMALRYGLKINERFEGTTLLFENITNYDKVWWLLNHGADISFKNRSKESFLSGLIGINARLSDGTGFDKNTELIIEILNKTSDLEYGILTGVSPSRSLGSSNVVTLMKLEDDKKHNRLRIFKKLIERGLNLNKKYFRDPTHYNNSSFWKLLDEVEDASYIILWYPDSAFIDVLLKNGTMTYVEDQKGNTPLMNSIEISRLSQVKAIVKNGYDLNRKNSKGIPPLLYAVQKDRKMLHINDYKIIRYLISSGAITNIKDSDGNSLLWIAVYNNDKLSVKALVDAGMNVNEKDKIGNTVLWQAVFNNYRDIIKTLVNAGADVNIKNKFGQSPLDLATKEKKNMVGLLLPNYSNLINEANREMKYNNCESAEKNLFKAAGTSEVKIDALGKSYQDLAKCFFKNNEYQRALECYSKASEYQNDPMIYMNKGICYYKLKKYDQARSELTLAINSKIDDEDKLNAYQIRGNSFRDLKNYEKAIEDYSTIIEKNTGSYNGLEYKAYISKAVLYLILNNFEESYKWSNTGIKFGNNHNMEYPWAYHIRATSSLYLKRNYDQAINDIGIVIYNSPDLIDYYNYGCLYSLAGKTDKAIAYFEKLLESGFNDFNSIENDSDWDNVRNDLRFKSILRKYKK